MTATEGSLLGFSRQARKGTAITDDTLFKYMLYSEGAVGPQNITLPLDPEVGGGALLRQIVKAGVAGMGQVRFIPRPETVGFMLLGMTGRVASRKNYVKLWNTDKACDGTTVTTFDREPASAVQLFIKSIDQAAGTFVINKLEAGTENVVLTSNRDTAGLLTFKTVTRVDYHRGLSNVRLYDNANNPLHAEIALSATAPTRVTTGLTNPAPASVVKVRGVSGTGVGGVKVYGTNSSDLTITEEIYNYATERVGSVGTFDSTTLINVASPISAGDTYNVLYHDGSYTHEFFLDYWDNFDAPWYTCRHAPGNIWGEQMVDTRFNVLSLDFAAANFLRGAAGWSSITPSKTADTEWEPSSYLDSGPQFLAALGTVELPDGTALSTLGGSFVAATNIPMDQQFKVGSYYPDGLDIVARGYVLTYQVKIVDAALYTKMMYDPAWTTGAATWLAEIYREGRLDMNFVSDQDACVVKPTVAEAGMPAITADYRPYKLAFAANNQAGDDANMMWFATPIGVRPQQQVVLNLTGQFLAAPSAAYEPITITLINRRASY